LRCSADAAQAGLEDKPSFGEHCATLAQATLGALQSSQTMLMSRRPAAQLCVDSDPGGWVDVQRQRKPIAEQSPA